jgi:hypothetical protein
VPLPQLAPVTAATAKALGAYARQMETVAQGVGPRPTAWSMVNASCQDRAMALEYVIASAPRPLPARPPTVIDTELTEAKILAVAAQPSYSVATINVTGPLVTRQTLVLPDGKVAPGEPDFYYWAYHHGVVLDVEGELRVLDLSLGDEPVAIATWLSGFVHAGTACHLVSQDEYNEIWGYWNSRFGNLTFGPAPARLCGYSITPLFTMRWEHTPADMVSTLGFVPHTMQVQTGSLITTLAGNHATTLPEADLARVTSRYQPGTVDDVCDRVWMDALCGPSDGGTAGDRGR